jgi:hypothetical protein
MNRALSKNIIKTFIEITVFNAVDHKLLPIMWESTKLDLELDEEKAIYKLKFTFTEEKETKAKEVNIDFPVAKDRDDSYRTVYKATAVLLQVIKEATKKTPILTVIEGGKIE